MKNLSISLFAALMLFFCASTVQAQNQSDKSSNVIVEHYRFPDILTIPCYDESLYITFTNEVHITRKILANGTMMIHSNASGEGIDTNDDSWKWQSIANVKLSGNNHIVSTYILHGPNGAKEYGRLLQVFNGNGDLVKFEFDPFCE